MIVATAPKLPSRIPSLDGLWAVSILLVLAAHAVRREEHPMLYLLLGHLGNYGVRAFFLISGFLITTILLKEHNATGSISLRRFYLRRAIRLFPAFYCFVAVIVLLDYAGVIALKSGDLFHTLTYTMNYHAVRAWWLNHTWSLAVEEQFYLLWPAVILAVGPRKAFKSALLCVCIVPLIRVVMLLGFDAGPSAMGRHFQAVADALGSGCCLAFLYNHLRASVRYDRIASARWYLPLVLGLIFAPGAMYIASPGVYYCIGQSVANVGWFFLIDYCVSRPGSLFGRILNLGPLCRIGVWSYSIYLWQELFLEYEDTGLGIPPPLNILCSLLAGCLSFYVIERPFGKLRDRIRVASAPVAVGHAASRSSS